MKRYKKIIIWIIGIIVVIILFIIGLLIFNVYRAHPQTSGVVEVPDTLISQMNYPDQSRLTFSTNFAAEIIRDEWGVPHIYADNDYTLFFAQGYVHAQDRLWQMEMNRRVSSGTLSEVFGENLVDMDRQMRIFGLNRAAEKTWEKLDEDTRFILEAYAAGINFFIDSNQGSFPIEYSLLGFEPVHWTPMDTLVWGNMLSFFMSYNHTLELVRARIIANNSVEVLSDLFPGLSDLEEIIIPEEIQNYEWLVSDSADSISISSLLPFNFTHRWASNSWAVSGQFTESGMPFLANDTHISLGQPSIWYENGLHGGSFDCKGFSAPGAPFIVFGHNQDIAWGITNMTADVQDLYIERLDDVNDPGQYQFQDEWHDILEVNEIIEIANDSPVEHKVHITRHGPIVNEALGLEADPPISLGWTLYEGSTLFQSLLNLNLASNWDEFRNALQYWDSIAINFIYADRDGNIGFQAACKMPIRSSRHQGLVPVPGWTGEYDWEGYVPFEELPYLFNPEEGFIANANNEIISYPHFLSYDWSVNHRVNRIEDLLNSKEVFTMDDMIDIQTDTYSLLAEKLMPYLLSVETDDELLMSALNELEDWDLRMDIDSIGASIFEVWYNFMIRNVFGEYLEITAPENPLQIMGTYLDYADFHQPALLQLMAYPESRFFDLEGIEEVETRDDMILKSLNDAVSWLQDEHGNNIQNWQWGNVQTTTFVHMPFGNFGIALIDAIFNSQEIPYSGGPTTVHVAQSFWHDPFDVMFGTSQRMIIDLSDFDQSISLNSTGQSGLVAHRNRFDQIDLWIDNQYKRMLFTREMVEEYAAYNLRLQFNSD